MEGGGGGVKEMVYDLLQIYLRYVLIERHM